jgi:hypothetical protein
VDLPFVDENDQVVTYSGGLIEIFRLEGSGGCWNRNIGMDVYFARNNP